MTDNHGEIHFSGREDVHSVQNLTVHAMTPSDLPAVLAIEHACFDHPWSEVHFLSSLFHKQVAKNSVAVLEERIVGFLITWYISGRSGENGEAHIHNIAVHPDYQRKGIGRKLLNHVGLVANEHRCTDITLEVRKSNVQARKFYEQFGFEYSGIRENYYGDEDALLMKAAVTEMQYQLNSRE